MNFRCGVISQLAVRGGIDGRERAYGSSKASEAVDLQRNLLIAISLS